MAALRGVLVESGAQATVRSESMIDCEPASVVKSGRTPSRPLCGLVARDCEWHPASLPILINHSNGFAKRFERNQSE